jgi:hypothetical protein
VPANAAQPASPPTNESVSSFDNLVDPRIGRGEYGGFLMSLPARRM